MFAAVDLCVPKLLRQRFATFRTVHLTTVGEVCGQFELLPTGLRPHFTVRLARAGDDEIARLLAVFGPSRDNPGYGKFTTRSEEVR